MMNKTMIKNIPFTYLTYKEVLIPLAPYIV